MLTTVEAIRKSNAFAPRVKAHLLKLAKAYAQWDSDVEVCGVQIAWHKNNLRESLTQRARFGARLNKAYADAPRIPHGKRTAR
jgi:hypothetical protein